jgi:hypothetical protein
MDVDLFNKEVKSRFGDINDRLVRMSLQDKVRDDFVAICFN